MDEPMLEKRTYKIKFPESVKITDEFQEEISNLNPDIVLKRVNGNSLLIEENTYSFWDVEFIEIKIPEKTYSYDFFEELREVNEEEVNYERNINNTIYIKMGILNVIGIITMAVGASLFIWAKTKNAGIVRSENTEFELKDPEDEEKTQIRMADVSYISYEQVPEEEQKAWGRSRIPVPPTLAIEIVSAKYGLKPALEKMHEVWIYSGTELGLVICPFSKKIYIFEKDIEEYTEQSIFEPFTHPLLPGYKGDFGEFVEENEPNQE